MIKVIAIGNFLMGDDGIALKVIDEVEKKFLKEKEKLENGKQLEEIYSQLTFIKAETDFNFALDNIEAGDFLLILDSTLLMLDYGTITEILISEFQNHSNYSLSMHNRSLLSFIKHLNIKVEGFILGIEVAKVAFSLDLSEKLKDKFQQICDEAYTIIMEKSLEYIKKGSNIA
ncbi:hydrogenase maturation protease [Clostridium cellulovorans 743B]|uniref:Hydrogenase maturation protease n=2 Tax=Clostridium cellulovorans TaxID=1493 RepID=D9SUK8_CLOC7|nr:hydrogenase maturation protease [Clostridium cellulovorans 743B]